MRSHDAAEEKARAGGDARILETGEVEEGDRALKVGAESYAKLTRPFATSTAVRLGRGSAI